MRNPVITLDSPTNSSEEREAKRPCRSLSSKGEESDLPESTSQDNVDQERKMSGDFKEYSRRRSKERSRHETSSASPEISSARMKQQVADVNDQVLEMEQQVAEVLRMRRASMKDKPVGITVTDDDREKAIAVIKKQRSLENARRESVHAKRAADLMRIFSNVLRQITQHRWAWPFMQPVDVEGLRLHDYYEIIKKPMDFGTIREKMDAKENGYRNVQEAADDVRLVFTNAMTYNGVGTDVYVMASTLSEKFDEKWKTVLEPKLLEEDAKRKQELMEVEEHDGEAEAKAAEEVALDRMAHEICRKLNHLEDSLEDLKVQATAKCRPMSIEEKRQLGQSLGRLPPAGLNRVIQIIAKNNPGFNASVVEVEVDIDALDTGTLWQLHCYVQMVLNHKQPEGVDQTPSAVVVKKRPALSKLQK